MSSHTIAQHDISAQHDTRAQHLRAASIVDQVQGLKKSGAYWIGPCPFCGGRDRFTVKQLHDGLQLWHCRHCGGDKYQDAIAFAMRATGKTFGELVNDGQAVLRARTATPKTAAQPLPDLAVPPDDDWQIAAIVAAGQAADYLRGETEDARVAYDYLRNHRKLTPNTLDAYSIGFNPAWRDVGLGDGRMLAPGISIPCVVDGELWYLKVRTTAAARREAAARGKTLDKYVFLKGADMGARANTLYGANELLAADIAIVTEGEFDALVIRQYCPPHVTAVTMGSASALPDHNWLRYLAPMRRVILLLDNDQAGRDSLARWQKLLPRATAAQLPDGSKDATDFRRAGGNVVSWVYDVTH